jgi:nitroreductase
MVGVCAGSRAEVRRMCVPRARTGPRAAPAAGLSDSGAVQLQEDLPGTLAAMDVLLAVASKRDVRQYAPTPIPEDAVRRILDAGRLAGSARNRQPWQFLVVENADRRAQLAAAVYVPANIHGATLVVAVTTSGRAASGFDCGRVAQNMMLAAWGEGIASCPNGIADPEGAAAALSLDANEQLQIVLSFGYPARPRDPTSRAVEQWSEAANRKPLFDLVRRL